ncbi:MAG: hypothetical protein NW207_05620 [Cytophagales bacterium]|nr:hypothetical protein [Cytophagales bacterium]
MSPQLYAQLCSSSGSLASGQVPNVGVNFGNISEVAYVNLFNQINMPFSAFGADGIVFDAATGATTNKANHNIVIGKDQSLHYPIVGVLKLSYKGTLSQANNFTATGGLTVVTSQANFPVNGYSYYELAVNINQVTTIGGEFTMQFHNVVSDIKLMRPGYELNENKIIIPQYESTFKGISVIRFKDYLNADNAFVYLGSGTCSTLAVINWADRSKPWLPIPAASIEGNINRGGSIESIVQICNQLNTDAWINIPVNASDNYITGLATYMKENLNPGRKVYYEVGNNIWSFAPGFCSNDQIDNKCGMYNFTCYPIWQVNRTKEITDIFASIWGWNEINQSVRALITGQTGNVSHLISKINYLKSSIGADQIGKYFYAATNTAYYYPDPFDVSSVNNIINNSYNNINNSLLSSTYLNNWSLQSYYERSLSEAGQYGLKNIVYEGGIDFGYSSGPTIAAAIRDPLMKTQIKYIMDKWFSRYGTDALFMFYKAKFDKTGYLTMGDMLDTYSGYVEGIKEVVNSPAPGLEISYRSTIPGIFDARNKERGFESAGEYPRIRPEAANDLQDSWVFSCLNAGRYNLAFEHKTGNPAGTTIDIYIDGVKVYDNLVLKATGEANNDIRMWSDVPHPALLPSTGTVPGTSIPLELSYGVHVMRIVCETPVNAFNLYDSFSQIKAERIIESTPTPSIVSGDLIVCESQPDGMLKVDYDPTVCNYKWFGLPPTASIAPNAGGPGTGLQKSGPNTNVIYVNWGNTPVGTYNMAVLAVNDLGTSTGRVFSVLVTSCGFTINPNQACTNSNISIQPNVSNATQYTWNFSTGANYSTYNTTSSGVLPIALVYTTPGSKTINLNVTLSGGLTKSFQRTLNINAPPVIGSISPNAISQCTVQDIVFSISGTGLYYQWLYSTDGGTNYSPYSGAAQAQVTFTGLTSTTLFKVQVANPGCSAITTTGTANAYVSSPIVSFSYGNNTYCAGMATPSGTFSGGSFSRLSGPGSIILNTMTGIISIVGSSAGIHTIRYFIPPVGSCPSISGISAITIAGGSSIFIVGSNSVCSGGNVILTASGANSYTWMPGNLSGAVQSVSPSGTTTYTVTGTTAQGCSAMGMLTVTVSSTPAIAINGTTSICTGGNTVLTASGANSYTWMPGNLSGAVQSVSPSATTTYTVTGTTAQGCSAMGMRTVTVSSTPAIAINGTTSICTGGNTVLTASGANSYTWMPGNLSGAVQSVSPSGTTTYTVTGTTAQGCSAMGMLTVTVSSTPTVLVDGTMHICTGASTVLTASGTSSFVWYPGSITGNVRMFSPTSTTTYTIVGSSGALCQNSQIFTISVSSAPTVNIAGTSNICTGGNTVLTASGANSYTWMPGNLSGAVQSVSPSGTTTYTVTGANNAGCLANTIFDVLVDSNSVSGNLSVTNSQLCFGNTINISLSGYYGVPNIYYNNMLISSQDMISAYVVTSNGVFYAVVKNGVCAEVTTSGVDVTIAPQVIKPIIQGVQTIVSGTIYTLYVNSITGETYQWTLSDNNTAVGINTSEITIAGFQVGVIKVSVFASNSCETDSSNIYLTVTNSTTPAPTVINSIANDNFVHIYPNPTSRYFTVECNECITPYLLNIYNSTGVKMLSKNVASNFENIYIDYSPGIYQIVINGKFYKLIIE